MCCSARAQNTQKAPSVGVKSKMGKCPWEKRHEPRRVFSSGRVSGRVGSGEVVVEDGLPIVLVTAINPETTKATASRTKCLTRPARAESVTPGLHSGLQRGAQGNLHGQSVLRRATPRRRPRRPATPACADGGANDMIHGLPQQAGRSARTAARQPTVPLTYKLRLRRRLRCGFR